MPYLTSLEDLTVHLDLHVPSLISHFSDLALFFGEISLKISVDNPTLTVCALCNIVGKCQIQIVLTGGTC